MRALFAVVVWLASLASDAGGEGFYMAAGDDVIHLADMAAPPWTASANERASSNHAGFDHCEQLVKILASRIVGKVAGETYTTSQRWDKILRAKINPDAGGSPMLVTCWVDARGRASIVVKIDDGKP
jgi:hypothetical protein